MDWTNPTAKGWKECLLEHSITPMQQFAYTSGKNATDSFMIIDAMDLLYTGRFSSFCIVSSDSDFTRLAQRIREQGVTVYGFGERKTHSAFIAACNTFTYFDVLNVEPEETSVAAANQQTPAKSDDGPLPYRPQQLARHLDQAALAKLANAIRNTGIYVDDWVNAAAVGAYLRNKSPDWQARNYGYERFQDLLKASGIVELKSQEMGRHPPILLVRLKEPSSE